MRVSIECRMMSQALKLSVTRGERYYPNDLVQRF
jgi:hypothetical protein